MLAASRDAALAAHRAWISAAFLSQKYFLERHHAGIGEQKRWIVSGHERTGGHAFVVARTQKINKSLS